jgi:hypothetical protein
LTIAPQDLKAGEILVFSGGGLALPHISARGANVAFTLRECPDTLIPFDFIREKKDGD